MATATSNTHKLRPYGSKIGGATVVFTATRAWTAARDDLVRGYLQQVKADALRLQVSLPTIVVGACRGGDGAIARWAQGFGFRVHAVVPANRTQLDPDWRACCDSFEVCPDGTDYRFRNTRMLDLATRMVIAVPHYPEHDPRSRRSGTWMTVRIARSFSLTVRVLATWEPTTPPMTRKG